MAKKREEATLTYKASGLLGGFTCTCGKPAPEFTAWVYAHWSDPLTHICDCGRQWNIQNGRVSLKRGKVTRIRPADRTP
jgi:hypothetical protein